MAFRSSKSWFGELSRKSVNLYLRVVLQGDLADLVGLPHLELLG